MSSVDEYRRKLQEHSEAKREKAKLFDARALAASTRQIYTVEDADLGTIRYGLLTTNELRALELEKLASDGEKAERVVYAMLKKADPSLTLEDYDALPFDVKALLVARLSGVFTGFLQRLQSSGLTQTLKPKPSA